MKTLKEIKVTKIDNGMSMSAYPLPEEIQKWAIENTMFKSQINSDVIHPFSLMLLAPGIMIPPKPINDIKPGTSRETEYNVLVKDIAFKTQSGNWDIYKKAIFNVYNRKTVGEKDIKNTVYSGFGSNIPIADEWNVTIKTDDAPLICDISLEDLFDKLTKIS